MLKQTIKLAKSLVKKFLPKKWSKYLGLKVAEAGDLLYFGRLYIWQLLRYNLEKARRAKVIFRARPYSLVARGGLFATYDIANNIERKKMAGCFVECGVARGGTSAIMAMVASYYKNGRKVWLFDSYEGLPEFTPEDKSDIIRHPPEKNRHSGSVQKGCCLGTYEEVSELMFSKLKLNKENILMVKGWFQNTLPKYKDKIGKISFLRIDGDWYESTKCPLEALYDNVVSGGYVYIDDYGSCIGCTKATDEFLAKRQLKVKLTSDNRGGIYFTKP